jgi:Uma2 family endonuclease
MVVGGYVRSQRLGSVVTESGFILAHNPDLVRGPDMAFVGTERMLPKGSRGTYFDGGPDLAVEIVSPNDTAIEVRELINEYLAAGTRLIWVIYPVIETIEVHRPGNVVTVLHAGDELDGEDVLPGFRTPVSELFD